jgi:hypothetical protein
MTNQFSNNIEKPLEQWFSQAPGLPENAKESLVKYIPVIALIFGIIGILLSLAGIVALTTLTSLALATGRAWLWWRIFSSNILARFINITFSGISWNKSSQNKRMEYAFLE